MTAHTATANRKIAVFFRVEKKLLSMHIYIRAVKNSKSSKNRRTKMKVIMQGESFVAVSTYDERDIPKSAGMRWDAAAKAWWTNDYRVVEKLAEYCSEEVLVAIADRKKADAEAIEKSRAVDSDINIPCPEGLAYLPFQLAGIAYAAEKKNCLIADEMGLGKTIQAIGVINATQPETVLVVCPASLKLNWRNELKKWLVKDYNVEIVNSAYPENANIVIINYDLLQKHKDNLSAKKWGLVMFDEAHYLKNPKAQRTQAGLAIAADRKIYLTGTPVVNRPIELYPILKNANVDFAVSWERYVRRYCNGHRTKWGWDVSGASNLDELSDKLRASIMMRREKSQVLTELPEKTRQIVLLPQNGAKAEVAAEAAAWENYESKTKEVKKRIAALKKEGKVESEEYKDAIKQMQSFIADFGEIAKLRHATALKKVEHVVDAALETVESAGSVVVFAHHKDVVDAIVAGVREAGISGEAITGDTAVEQRQKIVDDFQSGKIQVVVGSIKACGVGFTLTRSSNVIFAELDWTPAAMAQAEDRTHRIGQKNAVLVKMLVYDGSIDAMLAKKLVDKEEIIEAVLG
jgi:SWI/SNF-related matrix-associated actin-dependent regulator 1 of chromatin subfamily A